MREHEAAEYRAMINQLRAENARYKAALERIVNQTTTCEKDWQAYRKTQQIAQEALRDRNS